MKEYATAPSSSPVPPLLPPPQAQQLPPQYAVQPPRLKTPVPHSPFEAAMDEQAQGHGREDSDPFSDLKSPSLRLVQSSNATPTQGTFPLPLQSDTYPPAPPDSLRPSNSVPSSLPKAPPGLTGSP